MKTACGTHDKCRGKHRTVVLVLDTNQSSLISMISCKAYVNNGSVTCSFPKISRYIALCRIIIIILANLFSPVND